MLGLTRERAGVTADTTTLINQKRIPHTGISSAGTSADFQKAASTARLPNERVHCSIDLVRPLDIVASVTITESSPFDRFSTALGFVGGDVVRVTTTQALTARVARIACDNGSAAVLYEPDDLLAELGLAEALLGHGIESVSVADAGERSAELMVGVTAVALAIAETGTLLVGGRPGGWGLATVLPWVHVAVLRERDLYPSLAEGFAEFADRFVNGEREWVWISGPSRTADIAKTLVQGVHGPNLLEVLVLADAP